MNQQAGLRATRIGPALAVVALGSLAAACRQTAEPSSFAPPYIAVVTKFDAAPGVDVGQYTYRIRELSGTLGVDTTVIPTTPNDTIIVSVPNVTATYVISVGGIPAKCVSRYGTDVQIIVPENTNTTIVRYFVICKPLVTLYMSTEGAARDNEYLFRLSGNGIERVGRLAEQDTVVVEDVPPGDYQLDLAGIADNCTPISQGLREPLVRVPDQGGARVDFRIACSDPTRRPSIVSMAATYADGVNGVSFVATDPDRDMDWYQWDITDCHGNSVITRGQRTWRGILANRGHADTVRIGIAVEVEQDVLDFQARCASIRVWDLFGNTTPVVEVPLRPNDPAAPVAPTFFNATLPTLETLRTQVGVDISSPNYTGLFPTLRLRDGILSTPDGKPDVGIYSVSGYLEPPVPTVALGGRIQWYDVIAVELYVLDRLGNFRLLRDDQLNF